MPVFTEARSHVSRRSHTAVLFGLLGLTFAATCWGGAETVVSSFANCRVLGGITARWSDPAIWPNGQVPDNGRPPGVTYDVTVPYTCFGLYLDASVTVNQLTMDFGYWNGAKQKAPKVRADHVSLKILKDGLIDELGMTNSVLEIGGVARPGSSDGWGLTDTRFNARNYHQGGYAGTDFVRSTIAIQESFAVTDFAYADFSESSLQTQNLELSGGGLALRNGTTVKVKGDFEQRLGSMFPPGLLLHLNGHADFSVDGDVHLDGVLQAYLSDGYIPSVGEQFPILRYKGSLTGTWADVRLPNLPAGRAWSLVMGNHTVYLLVVPAT